MRRTFWCAVDGYVLFGAALFGALIFGFCVHRAQAEEKGGERIEAQKIATKVGCFECHSVEKAIIGPAYRDVAARYARDSNAREVLFAKVKYGGKGNWTEVTKGVPMPPHWGRLSDEEIALLVDWVLSQRPPTAPSPQSTEVGR